MIHPTAWQLGTGKLVQKCCLAMLGLILMIDGLNAVAYAGGFDSPEQPDVATQAAIPKDCNPEGFHTQTPDGSQPADQLACKPKTPMLDWQRWSQPYSQGQAVCRDRTGNLVCLTPAVAKKLYW